MCKSCVGSELSPASGSIYKWDTARNDSTLWNAEGKQYKTLKAEWYDINALLVTLELSIGNSRSCIVWIQFATEFLLQCFFSSLLPLAHSVDTWLPSIISQWDFLIQISVCQIQKSTIKNRETISINFNKFIKIWDACICSNQHWEIVPLKINMKTHSTIPEAYLFLFLIKTYLF